MPKDTELTKKRNRALILRYYYWSEIKRRREDDIYKILSTQEFFLKEETIYKIITANFEFLDSLYKTSPDDNKSKYNFTIFDK